MLKVDNLTKSFKSDFLRKRIQVLKEVTFNVDDGEIFGFIGPNGSGKTTTFKSILRYIPIDSGSISIMGSTDLSISIKSKIGYLPESPYFYDYLTAEELLNYMGNLYGMDKNKLEVKTDELLEKVNMKHAKKIHLRKYSKGMLQRIGIAQALINDPEFLILDEPMSGLDPVGRREIIDLILEQKKQGKTVILSSHILSDVETLCDRIGVIFNGKIVKLGKVAELLTESDSLYEFILNTSDEKSILQILNSIELNIYNRAGNIVLELREEIKNSVLTILNRNNIDIIRMVPLRKSLEDLFLTESQKN